ncbi:hypothetical protein GLOIN_2v1786010 [Rhizophagus irregularis DAOM 181602=DAOM 197198]|nr:hypothetical protein GLOIN_2v1786010 [Rhizophagus irregularis DAOM 181602=DAOM 197198]
MESAYTVTLQNIGISFLRKLWEAQQQNKEMSHNVIKKVKEAEQREQIILEKNEKIRKVSQEVKSIRLELKKAKSSTKNNRKGKGFPASKKLSEIREMFKFVTYKEIKEELRNHSDEKIKEFYKDQGWFFAKIIFIKGKRFIYTYFADQNKLEEAVTNSLVTGHMEDGRLWQEQLKPLEGHIKEKEMIKDNVSQSINKTQVLFEEIQKTNVEKIVTQKILKSATVVKSVNEEEVRCNKKKLSRGSFSSNETDEEIGSENIPTIVAKKEKSAQREKVRKVGNQRKRIRKSGKFVGKVSIISNSGY